MTKPDYDYAISGNAFEAYTGDSHYLFRRSGETVEVRVNRFLKQEEVFRPTTMKVDVEGTDVEEYIANIRALSAGLTEVKVASYLPGPEDFDGKEEFPAEDNAASPRLVITGWSKELDDRQKEALEGVDFF